MPLLATLKYLNYAMGVNEDGSYNPKSTLVQGGE